MVNENARLQLALIIPSSTPIAIANDAIEMLGDNIGKKHLMIYQNSLKKQYIY